MELEMAVADEEFGIVGSLSGEVVAKSVATLRSEAEANTNRKWDHIQTTGRHQTWYLYLGQATHGISDCISLHPSFKRLRQFDTFREIVIQYGSKDTNSWTIRAWPTTASLVEKARHVPCCVSERPWRS